MKLPRFNHQNILTADQFTKADLAIVVETATFMERSVRRRGRLDLLENKVMTALFYEPSSRTFGSFIAAMQRLGGGFIPLQGVTYSSVAKGETLADTVRTFASYSDVVVIRHPEVGSARLAAEFCDKPVINAGDGVGEHPTQGLLDFYTIRQHFPNISGLTVTLVGDLLNGRTIHSLAKLLSLFRSVRLNLIAPEILKLPHDLKKRLTERGVTLVEKEQLESVLPETQVLYITRVQKERFTDLGTYEKLKHRYIITPDLIKKLPRDAIIMHPFPRVGEIALGVDNDPRAVYISEQMRNGMYVRMAILSLLLSKRV